MCFVNEFDAFAGAEEAHRVLSDHVAAAYGVNPDFFDGPCAHVTHTSVYRVLRVTESKGFCDTLGESNRSPAGAVLLLVVMNFNDFHVVAAAEDARYIPRQFEQKVYAHAHVGREDDGYLLRGTFQGVPLRFVQPRGAHNTAFAQCCGCFGMVRSRLGLRKINENIGVAERRFEIVRDWYLLVPGGGMPRENIAGAFRHIHSPGNFEVGNGGGKLQYSASHASAGAYDTDACSHVVILVSRSGKRRTSATSILHVAAVFARNIAEDFLVVGNDDIPEVFLTDAFDGFSTKFLHHFGMVENIPHLVT